MAAQHHVRPARWLAYARRGRSTCSLGRPGMCQNNDNRPSGGRWAGTVVRLAVTRLATSLLLLLLAVPLGTAAAQSQGKEKVPRVGYISLGSSSDPARLRRFEAFRQGLRELGYVEGRNIALEPRWAEGYDRYPALAAELLRLKVDVIVAVGGAATKATKQVTTTVPIVMSVVIDPVGSGLVPSLAHPAGNVTGTSMMGPDLVGKQLQMLKEVAPTVSRMAVLRNPANPASAPQLREAEGAARALGVRLQTLDARLGSPLAHRQHLRPHLEGQRVLDVRPVGPAQRRSVRETAERPETRAARSSDVQPRAFRSL